MVVIQDKSVRKPTGGRYKDVRTKRECLSGSKPTLTGIGELKLRHKRTRGGSLKKGVLYTDKVNLYDPKTKKHFVTKLSTVKESGANRNFVRRNIITKGTIIETEKGMAIVTNRPGQETGINAVLK